MYHRRDDRGPYGGWSGDREEVIRFRSDYALAYRYAAHCAFRVGNTRSKAGIMPRRPVGWGTPLSSMLGGGRVPGPAVMLASFPRHLMLMLLRDEQGPVGSLTVL